MTLGKTLAITGTALIAVATVIVLAFNAKDVLVEKGIVMPETKEKENVQVLPTFYKQNMVFNATFDPGTPLVLPLYVQTTGQSQRIAELAVESVFVTLGLPVINVTGSIGGNVTVSGNVTALNPCEAGWRCRSQTVPAFLPTLTTVTVTLPDTSCSGVQECIAGGQTPYCPNARCDDLCMVVERYNNALTCSTLRSFAEPIENRLQPMYQCTRSFSGSYVRFIPSFSSAGNGYVQLTYSDPNCVLLQSQVWSPYGCQNPGGTTWHSVVPCDQACGSDGYGCEVSGAVKKPKDYCPMTQQCKVQGGSPNCANVSIQPPIPTPTRIVGVCDLDPRCGDGYGCKLVDFNNFTSTSQFPVLLYTPDLTCPQTQDCINNGNTPLCVTNEFDSTQRGSCDHICAVQRVYGLDGCNGTLEHAQIAQAYSCQNLWGTTQYYRIVPAGDRLVAFYDLYSDPGCNIAVSRSVITIGECFGRYTFDIVNCDEACIDYGCSNPYMQMERPIQNCPATTQCMLQGAMPWCQRDVLQQLDPSPHGRCDEICILLDTIKPNSTCASINVLSTVVARPYECKATGFVALPYVQSKYFDGQRMTISFYSDYMCTNEVQTLTYDNNFCTPGVIIPGRQYRFDYCYNVAGGMTPTSLCQLETFSDGRREQQGFIPSQGAECSHGSPVCTEQGGLLCRDLCWGYELDRINNGVFNNIGRLSECLYDSVLQKYVELDYFGNGAYLLRLYEDPLCFVFNSSYFNLFNATLDPDLIPNVPTPYGFDIDMYLQVGACSDINTRFSPACVPVRVPDADGFFMIPDYGNPLVLECTGNGRTPVCQNPAQLPSSTSSFQTTYGGVSWNLACMDLTLLTRSYVGIEFVPTSPGCVDFVLDPNNPPISESPLQQSCFVLYATLGSQCGRFSMVPVSSAGRDLDILLFPWDNDAICGAIIGNMATATLLRNGECLCNNQIWLGPTQEMNDEFLCKADGFGCRDQWYISARSIDIDPNNPVYDALPQPTRYCPQTQSCIQSGGSPVCVDANSGFCDEGISVWAESYSILDTCPNSKSQTFADFKSQLFQVGQCQELQDPQDLDDFPVVADSFIAGYYSIDQNSLFVLFQFYRDGACTTGFLNPTYSQVNFPYLYIVNDCYGGTTILQDATTWKAASTNMACTWDGYGCPQDGFVGADATPCVGGGAGNCKVQYSCPTTQSCLASDAFVPNFQYTTKATCASQTTAFNLQMGVCAWIPLALAEPDARIPHNGTHILLGNLTLDYDQSLYDRMHTPEFKQWLLTPQQAPDHKRLRDSLFTQGVKDHATKSTQRQARQIIDCTIGAAIVYAQGPPGAINITDGATLYIPSKNIIFGQVNAINFDGEMLFQYLSQQDTTWQNGIVTNVGEGIYLLAATTCSGVLVSGTVSYQIAFNDQPILLH